jgi:excisionase family DNA binding protein
MSTPQPITLALQLTPDVVEQLRQVLQPSVEQIADAVAARLRAAPKASTVPQLAKRLGRSKAFVYEQIKRGHLRATRPGGDGELVVTAEAEAAWLAGE